MKPDTKNPEYAEIKRRSDLVSDFMDEEAVKDKGTEYLKKPIAIIGDPKEAQMYETYKDNAYVPEFILSDALAEMLGMTFRSGVEVSLPDKIAHLENHADSRGNSLHAVFRDVVAGVLTTKRHAIVSDYGEQSFLSLYKSDDIYNWDRNSHGYTLVVLREQYESGGDEYKREYKDQLREFRQVDGRLEVHVWRQTSNGEWVEVTPDEGDFTPMLPKNTEFDFIPVRIPETERNPMYGMAKTIAKGYKVSADYYGMLYNLAFGTLVVYTDSEVTKVETGLHTGLKLSQSDKAEILKIGADGAAPLKEAMESLFDSAVSQGIRIIDSGGQKESGEALYIRAASKQVKLQDIVSMCAEEMKEALRVCAMLEGANPDEVEFSVDVELIEKPFDPEKIKIIQDGVESGLLLHKDYIEAMAANDLANVPVGNDGQPDYDAYIKAVEAEQVNSI